MHHVVHPQTADVTNASPFPVKVFGEEVRSSYRLGEEMDGLESEAKIHFQVFTRVFRGIFSRS